MISVDTVHYMSLIKGKGLKKKVISVINGTKK